MDEKCKRCYNYFSEVKKGDVNDSIYTCPTVFNNFNKCRICVDQLIRWAPMWKSDGKYPLFGIQTDGNGYKVGIEYRL